MKNATTAAESRDASYSADRIAYGKPVRTPFLHNGEIWVCTGISGSALTESGATEHEAYRIVPAALFDGTATTYSDRTGTAEAAEAGRNDPLGFYHGIAASHSGETFVLCGPPVRFAAEEEQEPAQLSLF
jgi:hypothetical protein